MNWTRFLLGLVIALAGLALISASAGTVNGGFIVGAPTLIIGGLLMSLATPKRTDQ